MNEKKDDILMLIDENLLSVIAVSFLSENERYI